MFSLSDHTLWFHGFCLLFLFKYLRLIVHIPVYYFFYKPVQPGEKLPSTKDVTYVLAALGSEEDIETLVETIQSALSTGPQKLILACPTESRGRLERMREEKLSQQAKDLVQIVECSKKNKRQQIVQAIPHVTTPYISLIDDDVILPPRWLDWALAPFADAKVGGVGTNQRLRRGQRKGLMERRFNFLGAIYLQRRNWDCTVTNWMDGGLPCLSGRAVMYRTGILKSDEFMNSFVGETWTFMRRAHILNADDDNFITRWLFSNHWKIKFQHHRECEVKTTLASDWNYVQQCVRWSRSNWRSNLTSLFSEGNVWSLFPWSTYAVFQTTLTSWAFLMDGMLFYSLYRIAEGWPLAETQAAFTYFFAFHIFAKFIKFLAYFTRYPADLLTDGWLLLTFPYFHNGIKLFSLFTIHQAKWGSRDDADSSDSNNERIRRMPISDEFPDTGNVSSGSTPMVSRTSLVPRTASTIRAAPTSRIEPTSRADSKKGFDPFPVGGLNATRPHSPTSRVTSPRTIRLNYSDSESYYHSDEKHPLLVPACA